MESKMETAGWKTDLEVFSKRNYLRPTRLEVLGPDRSLEFDFWLEDGLLLAGIDLETDEELGPSVEIMLQAPMANSQNHMTHTVTRVKRIALDTAAERDLGLEIENAEGVVTIVRFESEADKSG